MRKANIKKLAEMKSWLEESFGCPRELSATEALDQIEAHMIEIEPLGICVRVRDEHGNVVMKAGSDGKLRAIWRRTELEVPSTAKH